VVILGFGTCGDDLCYQAQQRLKYGVRHVRAIFSELLHRHKVLHVLLVLLCVYIYIYTVVASSLVRKNPL
jgi:hypothetical protein